MARWISHITLNFSSGAGFQLIKQACCLLVSLTHTPLFTDLLYLQYLPESWDVRTVRQTTFLESRHSSTETRNTKILAIGTPTGEVDISLLYLAQYLQLGNLQDKIKILLTILEAECPKLKGGVWWESACFILAQWKTSNDNTHERHISFFLC